MFDRRLGLVGPREELASEASVDDFLSRLVKLIPSEIIAAFVLLDTVLQDIENSFTRTYTTWAVVAVLAAMTVLYLHRLSKVQSAVQLAASTLAFIVWALATGRSGLTASVDPAIVTTGVVLFTLALPLVVRPSE